MNNLFDKSFTFRWSIKPYRKNYIFPIPRGWSIRKVKDKFKSLLKKPCVVLVVGGDDSLINDSIIRILGTRGCQAFRLDALTSKEAKSLFKKSKQSILIVNSIEAKKDLVKIREIARSIPHNGYLILNYDDEEIKEMKDLLYARSLLYGFHKGADLQVSDINVSEEGTNLKINYEGSTIPFWIKDSLKRKQIYNILSSVAVGIIKDMNLVEVSQKLSK